MDGQVLGYITAAGALSGVLIAVVNGILTRRRTGAEATEIITKAAGGLVDRITAENQRLDRRTSDQERRIDRLEEELEVEREERQIDQMRWERERISWRHTLQVHAAWDVMAIQILERDGKAEELPPTPPLTPPTRANDYPDRKTRDPKELS